MLTPTVCHSVLQPLLCHTGSNLCLWLFRTALCTSQWIVDHCLAFALALWGSSSQSAVPEHVGAHAYHTYPQHCFVSSGLFCFALISSLLAARSAGGQCVGRGLHLTLPGALSGKEILVSLCLLRLPLDACQHSPSLVEGCSAAPTETHVQGVKLKHTYKELWVHVKQ